MSERTFRPIPPMTEAQQKSFWSRVKTRLDSECWPWIGRVAQYDNRGMFSLPTGVFPAPRILWALVKGDAGNQSVCHTCDNPNCCNPAHLWLGTRGDNARDRTAKKRTSAGERHYLHKHPELRNGELNPSAKLTADDVLEIRESFYLLKVQLAEKYRITPDYIGQILRGVTWKHL